MVYGTASPSNVDRASRGSSGFRIDGAAAGHQERVDADVSGDVDGVLEVALNLVEDILGGPAEQNGAGLGVLALLDEGEVLVTDLTDLEFVS